MKQSIRIGVVCLSVAAAVLGCSSPSLSNKTYVVGDTGPAGGLIFFVKSSASAGWQYLEVAPSDQSTGMAWGTLNNFSTNVTDPSTGAGKANTDAIIAAETGGSAAQVCKSYSVNGYSDWFLPSFNELDKIFNNLSTVGLGNLVPVVDYWTSTENNSTQAAAGHYTGGTSTVGSTHAKTQTNHVRAVRSF